MSYIDDLFDSAKFAAIVDRTCEDLKTVDFDTIVFRGFSGALVGPLVALRLGKKMSLVRKPGDSSHSDARIEGVVGNKYIILDDFVSSGATVREIVVTVKMDSCGRYDEAECVGVYMWHESYRRAVVAKWNGGNADSSYNDISASCDGVKVLN